MKLAANVRALVAALQLLEGSGWRVTWIQGPPGFWLACRGDDDLRADDPLQLLGLLTLGEARASEPGNVERLEVYGMLLSGSNVVAELPMAPNAPPSDIGEMKALVYGLGRGCGIRLTPHHFTGDEAAAALDLAREVLLAEKSPRDSELRAFVLARFSELQVLVEAKAPLPIIAAALDAYIRARLWGGYGIQES